MGRLIRTYINDPRALPLLNRGKAWLRYVENLPDAYPGNAALSEAARNSLANRTLVGADGSILRTIRGPINFVSAQVLPAGLEGARPPHEGGPYYIGLTLRNSRYQTVGMAVIPLNALTAGVRAKSYEVIVAEVFHKEDPPNTDPIITIDGLGEFYEVQGEFPKGLSGTALGSIVSGPPTTRNMLPVYELVTETYNYEASVFTGAGTTHVHRWNESVSFYASGPAYDSTIGNGPNYWLTLETPVPYRNKLHQEIDTSGWEALPPGYAWPNPFVIEPDTYDPSPWTPGTDAADLTGVVAGSVAGLNVRQHDTAHTVLNALGVEVYTRAESSEMYTQEGLGWTLDGFLLGAGAFQRYTELKIWSGDRYLGCSRFGVVDNERRCFHLTRSAFSYQHGYTYPDVYNNENYDLIAGELIPKAGTTMFINMDNVNIVSTETLLSDASAACVIFNGVEYEREQFDLLQKSMAHPYANYYNIAGKEFGIYSMRLAARVGGTEYLEVGYVDGSGIRSVRIMEGVVDVLDSGEEIVCDGVIRLLKLTGV